MWRIRIGRRLSASVGANSHRQIDWRRWSVGPALLELARRGGVSVVGAVLLVLAVSGCGPARPANAAIPVPTRTPLPTFTPLPPTATPQLTPLPPTVWAATRLPSAPLSPTMPASPTRSLETPTLLVPSLMATALRSAQSTATPSAWRAADALKVYAGPGTSFNVAGQLVVGQTLDVTARSTDRRWLYITQPVKGWIAAGGVEVDPLATLPIWTTPNVPVDASDPGKLRGVAPRGGTP